MNVKRVCKALYASSLQRFGIAASGAEERGHQLGAALGADGIVELELPVIERAFEVAGLHDGAEIECVGLFRLQIRIAVVVVRLVAGRPRSCRRASC